MSAALNRANNTGVLFGKMPELLAPPKYYQKVEKVKGKLKKVKTITPEYIAYQKIITAIQGSKTTPAATAAKLRSMIISYIENYGYGNVPSMSLLPSNTPSNITTSELETGLNKSEITNMFVYALFMKYRNASLSQYFQPPMTSGNNYYTGIGPFTGGGDDNEAKYDFMTQAMLHSASVVPTKSGQVSLTWSTHSNLTKYLIEIDETHGASHQMTKCFLDIAHQNLITNPKIYSSQDCSKGIVSTCSVAGTNIPLWVLRSAKTQNTGSSPTTCSPVLTNLGTSNDPQYPATTGQDYMRYYQLLHSKSPTAPAKS